MAAPLVYQNPLTDQNRGGSSVSYAGPPDERSRAPAPAPQTKAVAARPPAGSAPSTPGAAAQINSKHRLEGKSSPVILGLDALSIQELSRHPGRLPELVQNGSLFTVPRGAAVQVEEEGNGVLKVLLLDGSMAGREGWVQTSQVSPPYRGAPNRIARQ